MPIPVATAGADFGDFNIDTDPAQSADLMGGTDVVTVNANTPGQVRVTFVSAAVGNGSPTDPMTTPPTANTDGGLAVRLRRDDNDVLSGPESRFDDEGIIFVSGLSGLTFDVRDLPSGIGRGDGFEIVWLGTNAADSLVAAQPARSYYFNAGAGDDYVKGGSANDFLVGNGGNDELNGLAGNDSFLGGGGNDFMQGGIGNDIIDGGADNDRLYGEDGDDLLIGGIGTDIIYGGIGTDTSSFAGALGAVFVDLAGRFARETGLTTGTVTAGTAATGVDTLYDVENATGSAFGDRLYGTSTDNSLIGNAGDDLLYGLLGNDDLLGGAGNDTLVGADGDDTLTGGAGNDILLAGIGNDTANFNVSTDGQDRTNLGDGLDIVNVTAAAGGQVRIFFSSGEVGNGNAYDSDADGPGGILDSGFAARFALEDGAGNLTGPVSQFDDEGIIFVSGTTGLTFDVRDRVTGAQRGDQFEVVQLGTLGVDTIVAGAIALETRSYYINAGMGDDNVTGALGNDFLVGGGGNDTLFGLDGIDSFIGGGGNDTIRGGLGNDIVVDAGAGLDFFQFDSVTEGGDTINLYSVADDSLAFNRLNFNEVAVFETGASATTGSATFLYNAGVLSYDADGNGAGVAAVIATLTGAPLLTQADITFYGDFPGP